MSKFFGALLMTVGLIVASTSGLCSLVFTGMIVVGNIKLGPDAGVLIGLIVSGFMVSAVGFWLFRRGRAWMRRG